MPGKMSDDEPKEILAYNNKEDLTFELKETIREDMLNMCRYLLVKHQKRMDVSDIIQLVDFGEVVESLIASAQSAGGGFIEDHFEDKKGG